MLLKQANSYSVKLSRISKKMKVIEKGKMPKMLSVGHKMLGAFSTVKEIRQFYVKSITNVDMKVC